MKSTTIKLAFVILLSTFVFTSAQAQMDKEDIGLEYSFIGSGNAKDNNEVSFNKVTAKGTLYRKITKKGALYFQNVSYSSINIKYSDNLPIANELEHFQSIGYSLGASLPMKNNWRITGVFMPTLASNFEGSLKLSDLRILGIVFLGKHINQSKSLYLNFGAMYSNTFGGTQALPYFSLAWNMNEKFKFELGFPTTGVTYKVSEKLSFGSKLFISGDNLTLGDDITAEGSSTAIDNIRISNFGWGLDLKKKFSKHLTVKLAGGYTFSRKFEFNDGSEVVRDFKLANNFYTNIGLSISF